MSNHLVPSKADFRWLALLVAALGIAPLGWLIYFAVRPHRPKPSYLRLAELTSPTFKYQYPVEGNRVLRWREVEIPEATGQKLMSLLRGSKSVQEYLRDHGGLLPPAYPASVGRLIAYEDGSETPSFSVEFHGYVLADVANSECEGNAYFVSSTRAKKLKDLIDEIRWGPIPSEP